MDEGQRVGAWWWWGGQVSEPAVCGHGFLIVKNKSNLLMAIQQCKLALIKVSHSASSKQSANAGSLAGTWRNDPSSVLFSPANTFTLTTQSHWDAHKVIFTQTNILFGSRPIHLPSGRWAVLVLNPAGKCFIKLRFKPL